MRQAEGEGSRQRKPHKPYSNSIFNIHTIQPRVA
jgi:hypothetical protein